MANTEAHPGSWLGDLTNEWKKAKPPEKFFIVAVVISVAGIAIYIHGKSSSPSQPGTQDTSGLTGLPANFQQGGGGGSTGTTSSGGGGTTSSGGGTTSKPPVKSPPVIVPKPIVKKTQPTTVTKVAASSNHGSTQSKPTPKKLVVNSGVPPIARSIWTPPPSRTPGSGVYAMPSHYYSPRPGPSGGQGTYKGTGYKPTPPPSVPSKPPVITGKRRVGGPS